MMFLPTITIFILLAISASAQEPLTIECSFEDSPGWHIIDSLYTCEVSSLSSDITELNTVVGAVKGEHKNGRMNQNVEAIRFNGQTVNFLPVGIHKMFPNLVAISVLSSHLKEIKQSDLQPFPKLRYLNLYENDLKIVRNNLFEFNPEIEVIGLHYNDIKSVDEKIFGKLEKLRFLWLQELNEERV